MTNEEPLVSVIINCFNGSKFIEKALHSALTQNYTNFEIITVLSPAWNTDWLSEKTRAKMLAEGISPPTADNKFVVCPNCKSKNTKVISDFGSTACQSLYSCLDCLEPFSYFKCHV